MSTRPMDPNKDQKKRDPDFVNAETAMKRASQRARQKAQQAGIGVVVVKDGQIVEEKSTRVE
jgi:LDH2 family malate/lactate/ureidoglycolate dehydrogenase